MKLEMKLKLKLRIMFNIVKPIAIPVKTIIIQSIKIILHFFSKKNFEK